MDNFQAALKWIKSFFRSEWTLEDYPLKYEKWSDDPDDSQRWSVRVIKWWALAGVGASRAMAFEDLRESFAAAREEFEVLPRPGTDVLIEFAPDDELRRYWGVTSRIVSEVLGLDPDGIFISDETSLWDFANAEGVVKYQAQILELFGENISHIEDGNLAEIAKFISDAP